MTPEFRLVHEDDVVGKLYVVEHRGIRFDINVIPWMGEDETSWGVEVETQARSVQDVREMDPMGVFGDLRSEDGVARA